MSRNTGRGPSPEFGRARDELFSHIHRCGVLKASTEQQTEWMADTIGFMGERYPEMSQEELDELRNIGLRFCQPVIVTPSAESKDEVVVESEREESEVDSEAAAA